MAIHNGSVACWDDAGPRRTSTHHDGVNAHKSLLHALARQQLNVAHNSSDGWSARVVYGAGSGPLRHLVLALRAGQCLRSEITAGCVAWTVQVLQGRVRLAVGRDQWLAWPGELLPGPAAAHHLVAEHDTVLLLTLVLVDD